MISSPVPSGQISSLPIFPHPLVLYPLAQLKNQFTTSYNRSSNFEDGYSANIISAACFSPPRIIDSLLAEHASLKKLKNATDSLFIMTSLGTLIQYDLTPHSPAGIPKDKISDDTPIELKAEPKFEWFLSQSPPSSSSLSTVPPLQNSNPLLSTYSSMKQEVMKNLASDEMNALIDQEDKWLSQVEIITHVEPHRRIWMGPQFVFKPLSKNGDGESESPESQIAYAAKSISVNMPGFTPKSQALYIETGSTSSLEQSIALIESYGGDSDSSFGVGDLKMQEDLADAMIEPNEPKQEIMSDPEIIEEIIDEVPDKQL